MVIIITLLDNIKISKMIKYNITRPLAAVVSIAG